MFDHIRTSPVFQIIPPKEWEPRKKKFNIDDLENVKIPDPIEQVVNGNQGIFRSINIKKRGMTAKEYYTKANSPKYKAPGQVTDLEDLERKYWKNITFVPPIYGADVAGSVTDNDCNVRPLSTLSLLTFQPGFSECKIILHNSKSLPLLSKLERSHRKNMAN